MSERVETELQVPADTAEFIAQGRRDDGSLLGPGVERSCCCPSRPSVRVLVPSATDRTSRVDLLLCGHHYRASRPALVELRAAVSYLTAPAATG